MCQKYIPNLSQIQPSLPTSQSFKYCKYQIKHTYFFKFIPKFNLLSLYLSHSNTVKSKIIQSFPNVSEIHPKFIPNSIHLSQNSTFQITQISLNLISQSLKYCKIQNNPKFPKCVRNTSQIYPKFNLLSLHLSHSNTVNIK